MQGASFPFASLYLKSATPTPFVSDLQNSLELYQIKLTATAAEADLTLDIVSESSSKQILAISGAGQVREFQLNYRVSLRAYDKQMNEWLPADEITLQRSLSYDDAQILAKEQEEALLYRDMRADAVQQVMRRLSRAKARPDPANMPEPVSNPDTSNKPEPENKPVPAK
ncbi:MAG TPA: LPS assembly lipoprotein LptE [Gallionellaceae bacterium]|nr:LPS assembly lipoprotein LptE [Gallionellaceae bacterium]